MDLLSKEYLSVREIELLTSISKSTFDKWRLSGDGPPYVKAGNRVIYRRTDVDRWLASRVQRSTAENGGRAA